MTWQYYCLWHNLNIYSDPPLNTPSYRVEDQMDMLNRLFHSILPHYNSLYDIFYDMIQFLMLDPKVLMLDLRKDSLKVYWWD